MLSLKEGTDFLLIIIETGEGLQSPRNAATRKTTGSEENGQSYCTKLFFSLQFATEDRKVVQQHQKLCQTLEHLTMPINMLLLFFSSGIWWRYFLSSRIRDFWGDELSATFLMEKMNQNLRKKEENYIVWMCIWKNHTFFRPTVICHYTQMVTFLSLTFSLSFSFLRVCSSAKLLKEPVSVCYFFCISRSVWVMSNGISE